MFDYRKAEITPGRTVEILMDNLPRDRWKDPTTGEEMVGDFPICHVEQLGPDNRSWVAAQIDKADPKKAPKKEPAGPRAAKKMSVEAFQAATRKDRDERREEIRHAVRRIVCRRSDGTEATDSDIPAWIAAIPQHAVDRIHTIAWNPNNYLDGNFADPNEIAEK